MLSRIASVTPVDGNTSRGDGDVGLTETPDVWQTDYIELNALKKEQARQFPDYFVEADQGTDETRYVIEKGVLYTVAEPHPGAGIYPRVVLPQQFRQRVIDRCHGEVGHSAFEKTLKRVQENYVWPGMRKAIREYTRRCMRCNTLTPAHPAAMRGKMPTPDAPFHTWGMDIVGP